MLSIGQPSRAGNVAADNSLGSVVNHTGNNFLVTAGTVVGNNLFHSLSALNLDKGETAQFTGASNIANVLARVTGGASTIDGTIQCDIAGSNFFLINPAGVVFGPDASLNVSGSFAVTTADVIHLADGGKFTASLAANSVLTTAAPSAFGFLNANPSAITVQGGPPTFDGSGNTIHHPTLTPAPNGSLTVIGGSITVVGGELASPGTGQALVVSVASPGIVNVANPTDTSSFTNLGTVQVQLGGFLGSDASSSGGVDSGPVTIVAGAVSVTGTDAADFVGSALGSFSGTGKSGDVIVAVTGAVNVVGGGELGSNAFDQFNATNTGTDSGLITISAASVTVSGTDASDHLESVLGSLPGSGSSEDVNVTAQTLSILDGGYTVANIPGTGVGGSINVNVSGMLTLDGSGASQADFTGISSDSFQAAPAGGTGGDINVSAGTLSILNGAAIGAITFGTGAGGNVNVAVSGAVTIDGAMPTSISAIFTATNLNTPGAGKAGDIAVFARTLSILNGGRISASTTAVGAGGNIRVAASGALTLDGSSPISLSGIVSATSFDLPGGGKAGDISVSAGTVSILNGALLNASTFGTGAAGNVKVEVSGALTLDNETSTNDAGIFAGTALDSPGGGNGGDITVLARTLSILNGANISAATDGTGAGGNVNVAVSSAMTLDNGTSTNLGIFTGTSLDTPGGGNGGNISVSAGTLSILNGAGIGANTLGTGTGGNINVAVSGALTLDNGTSTNSGITAESALHMPGGGNGGDITVSAGTLSILGGARIDASTLGTGAGGNVKVAVSGALTLDGATPTNVSGIFTGSILDSPGGGKAGDVTVSAATISIFNGAEISAANFGSGTAGNVTVSASGLVTLQSGSSLIVSSALGDSGDLQVFGGGGIFCFDSSITTQAGNDGGSISLLSPTGIIFLRNTPVSAKAQHDGGNITIDPTLVILDKSPLSADAVTGAGGAISITTTGGLLQQDSPITFTSTFGVQGSLTVFSPKLDVAASLVNLPQPGFGGLVQLAPTCLQMSTGDQSSFVLIGHGGLPIEPGGWVPAINLPVAADDHGTNQDQKR